MRAASGHSARRVRCARPRSIGRSGASAVDGQAPEHRELPLPDRQQAHHHASCRGRAGAAGRPRRARRCRARSSRCSPRDRPAARALRHQPRAQRRMRAVGHDHEIERAVRSRLVDDRRPSRARDDVDDLRAGDQRGRRTPEPAVQQVEQRAAPDAESDAPWDAGRHSGDRARLRPRRVLPSRPTTRAPRATASSARPSARSTASPVG